MTNEQRSQQVQGIMNALAEQQPKGTGPKACPDILKQRGADPVLRARALTLYASECMDVPHAQWNDSMRAAVAEETARVCREMGY